MKKIGLIFCLFFFFQAICFAQEEPGAKRQTVLINKNGEVVKSLPADYYDKDLSWPSITRGTGNKSLLIDKAGNQIELGYYVHANRFFEGMVAVSRCDSEELPHYDWCGYVDQTGKLIIPMKYNKCEEFSEGLALVRKGGEAHTLGQRRGVRYGFIDKRGKEVIKIDLAYASSFHEGLALVRYSTPWWKELFGAGDPPLYGYMDKTGKIAIEPKFREARDFSEGLAAVDIVKVEERGDTGTFYYHYFRGYIDKTGELVIQPQSQFAETRDFHEGLAAVRIGNKWGYIDKTGQIVIQPRFKFAHDFNKEFAYVKGE